MAVENDRVKVVSAAMRMAHYRDIRGPLRIGGVEPKHADSVLLGDTYHVCWFGTFTPEFCS